MNKKNYENITITDIAERAGVTRITFYRNFNTKDDIVKQYVQKYKRGMVESPEEILAVIKQQKSN